MSLKHFQPLADRWLAAGKPSGLLMAHDWTLMTLHLWVWSDGAKREGVSASLAEFEALSWRTKNEQRPSWYDALLSERSHCGICGESYRVENLGVCTVCLAQRCYRCSGDGGRASNGNEAHSPHCSGEIVG